MAPQAGDNVMVHPRATFQKQGPDALLAAVPELLADEETALELLTFLQTDAVPTRWHRRILERVVNTFLEHRAPDVWLTLWIEQADRYQPVHADERARLYYRALIEAPDDENALLDYLRSQIDDEYLHDADLSLPCLSPEHRAQLVFIADVLAWRIESYAPARDMALRRLAELDVPGRQRVERLLAECGWDNALVDLVVSKL